MPRPKNSLKSPPAAPLFLISLVSFAWFSSTLPHPPWSSGPMANLLGDKLLHASFSMLMGVSAYFSASSALGTRPARSAMFAFLLCLVVSVSSEAIQTRTPGRDSMSPADMCADAAGYLPGVLMVAASPLLRSRRRKIPRNRQP